MLPLAVNVDQTYDVASISWAIVVLVGMIILAYLIRIGIIKNFEFERNGTRFSLFGQAKDKTRQLTRQEQALLALSGLTDMKHQTANDVRVMQRRAIENYYDKFMDIMGNANFFPAEVMWRHFTDPLVNAADENHILTHVDKDGNIEREYVESKMIFVSGRYDRVVKKGPKALPPWPTIENELYVLMIAVLQEFVGIAERGWGSFHQSVERVRIIAPKWSFLIDEITKNVNNPR
jgi:hypothetical protein